MDLTPTTLLILWLGFNIATVGVVNCLAPRSWPRAMEAIRAWMRRICHIWVWLPIVWLGVTALIVAYTRLSIGRWPKVDRHWDISVEEVRSDVLPSESQVPLFFLVLLLRAVVIATPLLCAWGVGWSSPKGERARHWAILGIGTAAVILVSWLDPWQMVTWLGASEELAG